MLKVEGVEFRYDDEFRLSKIDLAFQIDKIYGLVGLNGAGKSTLFDLIASRLKPDRGVISCNSQSINSEQVSLFATQNFFYDRITGAEYISLFQAKSEMDIYGLADLFEIPLDKLVDDYSTGMKKKLAFAAIISQNRPVLLLDEPFNGVDLQSYEIMKKVMLKLKKAGKLIIVSSHILESMEGLCDEIVFMKNGNIEAQFPIEMLREKSSTLLQELHTDSDEKLEKLFRVED